MSHRACKHCGKIFTPHQLNPKQEFCSRWECQLARRNARNLERYHLRKERAKARQAAKAVAKPSPAEDGPRPDPVCEYCGATFVPSHGNQYACEDCVALERSGALDKPQPDWDYRCVHCGEALPPTRRMICAACETRVNSATAESDLVAA